MDWFNIRCKRKTREISNNSSEKRSIWSVFGIENKNIPNSATINLKIIQTNLLKSVMYLVPKAQGSKTRKV